MIAYIKGKVEDIADNYIVIDVNGIGFKIYTSLSTIEKIPSIGCEIKVHTYFHIREDIMDLYGFSDKEELTVFERLISVSGVGPKVSIAVLSSITPSGFALAVANSDFKALMRAPGIGNKIAQRIVLELKDKIKAEDLINLNSNSASSTYINCSSEAVNALISLGYSYAEASRAIQSIDGENLPVEEVVKLALKNMVKER
jgi:Holliday junction DNA helicase RuvA